MIGADINSSKLIIDAKALADRSVLEDWSLEAGDDMDEKYPFMIKG